MPKVNNRCNSRLVVLAVVSAVIVISLNISYNKLLGTFSNSDHVGIRAVESLKFVVVISRHGNRAGLFTYPNDPYPKNNSTFWPYGGHNDISSFGRIQMFNLGEKVRSLYNGFLGPDYYPNEFLGTSTAIDRTLVSGEAFLAGLFPPTGHQLWNKKIPSQLVPLFSTSPDKSLVSSKCEKVVHLRKLAIDKIERDNKEEFQVILQHITKYAGFNATDTMDMFIVWDTLVGEDTEGFPLPDWAKEIYPKPLTKICNKLSIAYNTDSEDIIRLVMGKLFKDIIETMNNKINGSLVPDRKMVYYSGHDHTLISLQYIFGIPKSLIGNVSPASALIVELHEDPETKAASVQLLFIDSGSSDLTPQSLSMPSCGSPCSLQEMAKITKRFTNITDYEKECKINSTPDYLS